MTDIKKSLLEEAEHIINGNRRQAYGKPEQNFERIAALWDAYIGIEYQEEDFGSRFYCEPKHVPMFMILMKIARLAETPDHRDSIVDMIGYAACYGELMLAKEQPLEEYTNEAIDEIVAGSNNLYNKLQSEPPPITKDDFLKHMEEQGLSEYLDKAPIVPRTDDAKRTAFLKSAKIGDKVQYTGTLLGPDRHRILTGTVTEIDDFHAWMRLQIDGEWINNYRIVAIT